MKVARECNRNLTHEAPKLVWIEQLDNNPFQRFICKECNHKLYLIAEQEAIKRENERLNEMIQIKGSIRGGEKE